MIGTRLGFFRILIVRFGLVGNGWNRFQAKMEVNKDLGWYFLVLGSEKDVQLRGIGRGWTWGVFGPDGNCREISFFFPLCGLGMDEKTE